MDPRVCRRCAGEDWQAGGRATHQGARGRGGVCPPECREGAEDFYLYQTLWNRIQVAKGRTGTPKTTVAIVAAEKLLEDAISKVEINQRKGLEGFDADTFKIKVLDAIQSLQ